MARRHLLRRWRWLTRCPSSGYHASITPVSRAHSVTHPRSNVLTRRLRLRERRCDEVLERESDVPDCFDSWVTHRHFCFVGRSSQYSRLRQSVGVSSAEPSLDSSRRLREHGVGLVRRPVGNATPTRGVSMAARSDGKRAGQMRSPSVGVRRQWQRQATLVPAAALVLAVFPSSTAPAPVAARDSATAVGPAATVGLYRGRTSQGWRLAMRVAANGRLTFATTVSVSCNPGGRQNRPFAPPVSFRIANSQFGGRVSRGDGSVYQLFGRFTGRASAGGRLTLGSTRIIVGGIEVCVSRGWVRWSAIRVG